MASRKKPRIRSVGVVLRPNDPDVAKQGLRLAAWLAKRKIKVLGEEGLAGGNGVAVVERAQMLREADLVVVLGGDGSLIGTARLSGRGAAPVLGINHGELGFLTDSNKAGTRRVLERVLAGDFAVEARSILSVTVKRGRKTVFKGQALNDAVVTRATFSRLLRLDATVDGENLAEYLGDGLIVATPTGSTAYSLSAGGPVVEPTMSAIIVTPISPHTLASRPVVLPDRSKVGIKIERGCDDAVLTLDGQEWFELSSRDVVEASRSSNRASIVVTRKDGFFDVLRSKLHWGARGGR